MHRDVENRARQGAQSARARQLPRGPRTRAPRGLRDHGTAICRCVGPLWSHESSPTFTTGPPRKIGRTVLSSAGHTRASSRTPRPLGARAARRASLRHQEMACGNCGGRGHDRRNCPNGGGVSKKKKKKARKVWCPAGMVPVERGGQVSFLSEEEMYGAKVTCECGGTPLYARSLHSKLWPLRC